VTCGGSSAAPPLAGPGAHVPARPWFGGLTLTREDDGSTTMRGAVTDQAELHGLLAKIRDPGAPLLSVNTSDTPGQVGGRV
jgi:hypothetical protein